MSMHEQLALSGDDHSNHGGHGGHEDHSDHGGHDQHNMQDHMMMMVVCFNLYFSFQIDECNENVFSLTFFFLVPFWL